MSEYPSFYVCVSCNCLRKRLNCAVSARNKRVYAVYKSLVCSMCWKEMSQGLRPEMKKIVYDNLK